MVYLVLKELAPHSEQDHIIIVVASLTKDMNDKNEIYRANAIRVLCRIIEVGGRAACRRCFFFRFQTCTHNSRSHARTH